MTIQIPRSKAFLAAALILISTALSAQDLRDSLTRETEAAFNEARGADVPLLSPGNFQAAEKSYARAEDKIRRGKSIDSIRKDLAVANDSLKAAEEAARIARVTFSETLKVRDAAVTANAATLATEQWSDAEKSFDRAARRLEAGDVNRAKTYANDARAVYARSELTAIQGAILNEARKIVAAARAEKVEKFAPDTLAKAERLVARAEADLQKNRYSTEGPLAMAREAEYEAKHSRYLAAQAQRLKNKQVTPEQLVLEWEQPLGKIAAALDSSPDMSAGYAVSRDASLARIEDLKAKAAQLEVANARVAELEESLGMTTERAQASELRQRRVDALESLFRPNEARILQEEGNVIIRLVGLSFDSGESLIKSQYFQLLRKIADVPDIFPGASLVLVVEGHTDSVGNDTMNLALSERRANSVRDYLLASTILPGSQVRAVGYGETRPAANNETAEGRAMNRRIDVVIVPDER